MPSPGVSTLAAAFAVGFSVDGNPTQMAEGGDTVQSLAAGIDAGWTSASPATPTSMASALPAEFSQLSGDGGGFIDAIAEAIDEETEAWVASYDSNTGQHTYVVTAAAIEAGILSKSPLSAPSVDALATAIADTFETHFDQQAG